MPEEKKERNVSPPFLLWFPHDQIYPLCVWPESIYQSGYRHRWSFGGFEVLSRWNFDFKRLNCSSNSSSNNSLLSTTLTMKPCPEDGIEYEFEICARWACRPSKMHRKRCEIKRRFCGAKLKRFWSISGHDVLDNSMAFNADSDPESLPEQYKWTHGVFGRVANCPMLRKSTWLQTSGGSSSSSTTAVMEVLVFGVLDKRSRRKLRPRNTEESSCSRFYFILGWQPSIRQRGSKCPRGSGIEIAKTSKVQFPSGVDSFFEVQMRMLWVQIYYVPWLRDNGSKESWEAPSKVTRLNGLEEYKMASSHPFQRIYVSR